LKPRPINAADDRDFLRPALGIHEDFHLHGMGLSTSNRICLAASEVGLALFRAIAEVSCTMVAQFGAGLQLASVWGVLPRRRRFGDRRRRLHLRLHLGSTLGATGTGRVLKRSLGDLGGPGSGIFCCFLSSAFFCSSSCLLRSSSLICCSSLACSAADLASSAVFQEVSFSLLAWLARQLLFFFSLRSLELGQLGAHLGDLFALALASGEEAKHATMATTPQRPVEPLLADPVVWAPRLAHFGMGRTHGCCRLRRNRPRSCRLVRLSRSAIPVVFLAEKGVHEEGHVERRGTVIAVVEHVVHFGVEGLDALEGLPTPAGASTG